MGDVHEVEETRAQSNSPTWHELRYARVTASILHSASRCKTDGSLVEVIFGAKLFESAAMRRGKDVEIGVKEVLKKKGIKVNDCGLFLTRDYPIFGASPDGVNETHIIEIKCPSKTSTMKDYIDNRGEVTPKCMAQMQLQMFICKKKKGLFVVAEPNFETTKNVTIKDVPFNDDLCKQLMTDAETFWMMYIFPKLNQ